VNAAASPLHAEDCCLEMETCSSSEELQISFFPPMELQTTVLMYCHFLPIGYLLFKRDLEGESRLTQHAFADTYSAFSRDTP